LCADKSGNLTGLKTAYALVNTTNRKTLANSTQQAGNVTSGCTNITLNVTAGENIKNMTVGMLQDYISFLQFFTTTNKKIVKGKSTNATISRVKFNSTYQLLGFTGTDETNLIDSLSVITSDSACTFN
jgi:hypothetical protein